MAIDQTDAEKARIGILGRSVDDPLDPATLPTTWTSTGPAGNRNTLNTTERVVNRAINSLNTGLLGTENATAGFDTRFSTVVGAETGADQGAFTSLGKNLIQAVADLNTGGNAAAAIAAHNTDANAHSDIRNLISGLVLTGGTGAAVWGQVTGTLADQGDVSNALDTKQALLVSGTNLKTVGGQSLLGPGDIPVATGGGAWGSITGTLAAQTDLQNALDGKATNAALALKADQSALTAGLALKADVTALDALQTAVDGKLSANQTITLTGDVTGSGATGITTTLGNTGVAAGTYQGITVDSKGRVTAASNMGYTTNAGTVTSVATGTGLSGGPITATGTIALANTAITAGTYQGITFDAQGRATAAANQSYLTGNQTITLSGDATGSGTTAITATVVQAPKLTTARTITVNANATAAASFDGTANVSPGVSVTTAAGTAASTLPAVTASALQAWLITARNCLAWIVDKFETNGDAKKATVLATARTITVTTTATAAASFDGSANVTPGVSVTTAAGTAANTLPAVAATALQTWLVTCRNCLDWLVQRAAAIPTGGTTGQVLAKTSATNFATNWIDAGAGASILGTQPVFSETTATSAGPGTGATIHTGGATTGGWGVTGTAPTQTWSHAAGAGTGQVSWGITGSVVSGQRIQVTWTQTVTAGSFIVYLQVGATDTTNRVQIGSQTSGQPLNYLCNAAGGITFTHIVVVPVNEFAGTFQLNTIRRWGGVENSHTLRIKSTTGQILVKGTSLAIGENAGRWWDAPTNSVAIGMDAESEAISGNGTVAIGFAASRRNNANYTVALGMYAAWSNTSGSGNTALGYRTLSANVTGTSNCAAGYYALGSTGAAAGNNTGFGYYALRYVTGSGNTGIGHNCGGSTAAVGAAVDSIFIGRAAVSGAANATNQIVIGAGATGNGSNTVRLGSNAQAMALYVGSSAVIAGTSDARLKENVEPADLDKCLQAVRSVPVSRWKWADFGGKRFDWHVTGWMADDFERVFPKAIHKSDEQYGGRLIKDCKAIASNEALPTLWGAVQKLIEDNDRLKREIAELRRTH